MDVATGALPSLLSKLGQLLSGDYILTREVKEDIKFLHAELERMQIALLGISEAPAAQLENMHKLWAREVRELSYDIEDRIDMLMLHKSSEPIGFNPFKKFTSMSLGLLMPTKIATEIKEIKSCVKELGERRRRYKVDSVVAESVTATVDPRISISFMRTEDLVGIDEPRDEVIKILMEKGEGLEQQGKVVSIAGSAGLGKTTLAFHVYKQLRAQFECSAFISASRNPDMKKLLENILYGLDKERYCSIYEKQLGQMELIDLLREFLDYKRYFIVIDDIWEFKVWHTVRYAFPYYNREYRVITTTRNLDIARFIGGAYIMKPLSLHNSRILLCRRIFGNEDEANCLDGELAEVSDKMLKRCAGLPLAIITIAGVLASKGRSKIEWYSVYNSIGTGLEYSRDVENMRKILSFSYYDLPSSLKALLIIFKYVSRRL